MLLQSLLVAAVCTLSCATPLVQPEARSPVEAIQARHDPSEARIIDPKWTNKYAAQLNKLHDHVKRMPPERIPVDPVPTHRPPPRPPVKPRGYIRVKDTSGKVLGFVNKTLNHPGEYVITTNKNEALLVTFDTPRGQTSFDITALNQALPFPVLGGIVGWANSDDNINVGSSNYLYLAGVNGHTPLDSAPIFVDNSYSRSGIIKNVETAIWKFEPSNSRIIPQWVNTDHSKPATAIVLWGGLNNFLLTGDAEKFIKDYGGPTVAVEFFLVKA